MKYLVVNLVYYIIEIELLKLSIKELNAQMKFILENSPKKKDLKNESKTLKHELAMNRERTFNLEIEIQKAKELNEFIYQQVPNKINYMIAETLDYVLIK